MPTSWIWTTLPYDGCQRCGLYVNLFGTAEEVTIRRMLSHESGLPAEPPV